MDQSFADFFNFVSSPYSLYSKVTVNDFSEIFPDESVLVQTTVVSPNGNKESDGGEQDANENESTLS